MTELGEALWEWLVVVSLIENTSMGGEEANCVEMSIKESRPTGNGGKE